VDWNLMQTWYLLGHSWCPQWTSEKHRSQKLVHVLYSEVFHFYSSVFQFKNNVTIKWYIFHIYTMHI
jgi:hypothetical protein